MSYLDENSVEKNAPTLFEVLIVVLLQLGDVVPCVKYRANLRSIYMCTTGPSSHCNERYLKTPEKKDKMTAWIHPRFC